MDNNFNSQQPMEQSMYQPMEQSMYQPMEQPMYQQISQQQYNVKTPSKSKNGLIIAIVIVAILCVIVAIFATAFSKEGRIKYANIVGTWESENGISFTFKKGNKGTAYFTEAGVLTDIKWEKQDDSLKIVIMYDGQLIDKIDTKIVDFNDKEMALDYEGDVAIFKKKK